MASRAERLLHNDKVLEDAPDRHESTHADPRIRRRPRPPLRPLTLSCPSPSHRNRAIHRADNLPPDRDRDAPHLYRRLELRRFRYRVPHIRHLARQRGAVDEGGPVRFHDRIAAAEFLADVDDAVLVGEGLRCLDDLIVGKRARRPLLELRHYSPGFGVVAKQPVRP
jgi:hypothetical protein